MRGRILIVEAAPRRWDAALPALAADGYEVVCARDPETALRALEGRPFDAVLCEAAASPEEGRTGLLDRIAPRLAGAALILCGARESEPLAREALARGAYDVLPDPITASALRLALRRVQERGRLQRTLPLLERELDRTASARPIVAASPAMIELLEALEHLAVSTDPVLLVGEPGTGRESIARTLHAQSPRRQAPFVAFDGAGQTSDAIERALFGAPRSSRLDPAAHGAVTLADAGTLFLEDVVSLPLPVQEQLARVVQDREVCAGDASKPRPVDLRLIAACETPLHARVRDGSFSSELHTRLEPAMLRVPPLRERREDIPLLIDHFLARAAGQLGRSRPNVGREALSRLVDHAWPGNLRELEAAVLGALLGAERGGISTRGLPDALAFGTGASDAEGDGLAMKPARKRFEAEWIRAALRAAGGNRTHAARRLQISHRALLYKLKEYGISD